MVSNTERFLGGWNWIQKIFSMNLSVDSTDIKALRDYFCWFKLEICSCQMTNVQRNVVIKQIRPGVWSLTDIILKFNKLKSIIFQNLCSQCKIQLNSTVSSFLWLIASSRSAKSEGLLRLFLVMAWSTCIIWKEYVQKSRIMEKSCLASNL